MRERLEVFQVTIVPTPFPNVQVIPITLSRPGFVRRIDILIPDGVNGVAGIALRQAGEQIIPFQRGTFLVGNDETISFPVNVPLTTENWEAVLYNNGAYNHTFYLRFFVVEPLLLDVDRRQDGQFQFIPLDAF